MKPKKSLHLSLLLASLFAPPLLSGCASGPDPWKAWNHGTQAFNDSVDKHILKPVAKGYQWLTPDPVDRGVSNFFNNIDDIGVTINDFLQFKLKQGGMDAGRFLVNTTVGVAGIIDVAQMIDLPKHNEDFGQTLGYWGVPSGPYLVLPFWGASSPRDTAGLIGDALFNPLTYVSIFGGAAASAATAGSKAVSVTDTRADLLTTEKIVDEATGKDRYEFVKSSYQQRREYLINDGNAPEIEDENWDVDAESNGATDNSAATAATGGGEQPAERHILKLSAPAPEEK